MKRIVSALLALCLLMSLVPVAGAVGAETNGGIADHYSNYTLTLYVGEYWSEYYGSTSSKAYSVSGKLPDGLEWERAKDENSGRISGTPSKAGQYSFTVNYEIESGNTLDQYHDTYYTTVTERHVDDRSSEVICALNGQPLNRILSIDERGGLLTDVKLTQKNLPSGVNWQKLSNSVRLLGTPTVSGYYAPSVFYSSREDGTFNAHTVYMYVYDAPDQTSDTLVVWENEPGRHYLDMDAHGTEPQNVELVEGQLPAGMDWSWGAPGVHVDGPAAKAGTYTVKFLLIRDDFSAELQTLTIHVLPANCQGSPNCPGAVFKDMPKPGNWAHKGLDFCVAAGLITGTSATTISPNTTMSRAMLVNVLYRLAGSPGPGSASFSDVKPTSWYGDAVSWAAENGIVTGTGGGKFNPNGNTTRQEIVSILYRYADYCGMDVNARADLSSFPDAGSVSSWAKASMEWAVAIDLVGGVTKDGKVQLDPKGTATRAQVATILMRFICGD